MIYRVYLSILYGTFPFPPSADHSETDHYGNVHLVVYPEGTVLWVPPSIFQAECPLDLTYWPYDTQKCVLLFGSWTKNGWEIDVQLFSNDTNVSTDFMERIFSLSLEVTLLFKMFTVLSN